MLTWNADPTITAGILAATAAYVLAGGPWREELGGPPEPDRRRSLFFLAAMLTLVLALISPIDTIGDTELFSVHMVQHLLLTLVFPPLLLLGLPGWMLRPLLRWGWVRRAAYVITRPVPAYLVFNLIFAASHIPGVYDLVQSSEQLHGLEHIVFMVTAVILWWPLLSPLPELPRVSYPLQLLYTFIQTLIGGMTVGAFLSLSGRALYQTYASTPYAWGLTPLQDQQIGGLLMWVGGGLYFFLILAAIFFRWSSEDAAAGRAALAARAVATPRAH